MKLLSVSLILLLALSVGLYSCSTELEIFEEPQDIWVVYGVLDPQKQKQIIRVSKVFQIEADAYVFSETYDPAEKGLKVVLEGGGQTWEAKEVNDVVKDTTVGDFGPLTTYYEIETVDDEELLPGVTYFLKVTKPGVDTFSLSAQTTIPPRPKVLSPRTTTLRGERCLHVLAIEEDVFVRFNPNPDKIPANPLGFQIEVKIKYFKDGKFTSSSYGPTPIFSQNENCNSGGNKLICRNLKNGIVLAGLRAQFKEGPTYSYDDDPTCGPISVDLVESVELQIHAHDTALTNYILVNTPQINNLQQIRPEYSNLKGTGRALGIFGSTQTLRIPVAISPCAEYQFYLRENRPATCPIR